MKLVGLSRQIALTMMAMAFGITLLVVLTSYAFYYVWQTYWPEQFPEYAIVPTGPEWVWLLMTTLTALALAAFVAVNLSRRILAPLNSVTDSIRRVAQGDLSARAVADDLSLGEAAQLAEDFNHLADQLQRKTEEQTFWNAAIAHELRTPVTILRGRLQGLAEGIFSPDERQFRSLLLQVEGLNQLIEDLRVVSLAESGHLSLHYQQINLAAEIRSLVDFISDSLAKSGQYLVLDLQITEAYCDPSRIRQALIALLENTRKHANPGQILIKAYSDKKMYRISVLDNGPGIPEDFSPYVFTAFRRLPNAHSSGSGLGLAVVASIAQAHGGTATYRTTSHGGALFEICWPYKELTSSPS